MKIRLLMLLALCATTVGVGSPRQARTLSENKSVVLRSEAELWSKGDLAVADELFSDFCLPFCRWVGRQGIKEVVAPASAFIPRLERESG